MYQGVIKPVAKPFSDLLSSHDGEVIEVVLLDATFNTLKAGIVAVNERVFRPRRPGRRHRPDRAALEAREREDPSSNKKTKNNNRFLEIHHK